MCFKLFFFFFWKPNALVLICSPTCFQKRWLQCGCTEHWVSYNKSIGHLGTLNIQPQLIGIILNCSWLSRNMRPNAKLNNFLPKTWVRKNNLLKIFFLEKYDSNMQYVSSIWHRVLNLIIWKNMFVFLPFHLHKAFTNSISFFFQMEFWRFSPLDFEPYPFVSLKFASLFPFTSWLMI